MSAPFLRVRGLSKRFGATEALAAVDLEVAPGELVVVLGPTGAGKTTLLRAIAGLERVDGGAVEMGGEDVTALPPAARDVALVFQNFSLYPDRTVRANLEFPLRAPGRGLAPDEVAARVSQAARTLSIGHLLDRRADRLSGGEMQRVAIGRAIVRRPRLFLMDEPLTNLDAKLRESLRVEIVALARALGTPLLFVTHDQAEALSMGDRIVVLRDGRVLQSGDREDVYLRPRTPAVARLLGQPPINVLEATARGGAWRAADGTELAPSAAPDGARARLGVRPEHLLVGARGAPARVEIVEETGPAMVLVARWAGARVHVLVARHAPFAVGQELALAADPARVVVWPEEAQG